MFIRATTLKRLCKEAYTGAGLTIGNINGYYLIMGTWRIEVENDFLNKKAMAALVELVGPLPQDGEAYKYRKNEDPQSEIPETVYINLRAIAEEKAYRELEPTRILVETNGCLERMLQDVDQNKYYINQEYFAAPTETEVECNEGETQAGPPLLMDNGYTVIWKNNVMAFSCSLRKARYKKEQQLLEEMKEKDMYWKFVQEEEL